MLKLINKLQAWLFISALIAPSLLCAADSQFYFVARTAPAGSITSAGQTQQVVYLRWDEIEGKLPSSVVSFRLQRKGPQPDDVWVQMGVDWPADAVMGVAEIAKLYNGPAQQRRKLEIITRLNELASAQGASFSANQFASGLRGLIDPANTGDTIYNPVWPFNPLWAFLGSRTDFNIARARYRGWIDTAPIAGDVEYELLGVAAPIAGNTERATVRLGLVSVNINATQAPLGATKLWQVIVSDTRCDFPEAAKDHYTVRLNWDSPGEKILSDRLAAQSYISGFDLYRSTANLAGNVVDAPDRDIAALAALTSHNSRGEPEITGLEKVNVSLVIDPGVTTAEPKWMEARDLLERAGLKPGNRRAYYLVPRDFTGNYGPTVGAIVEVPLMTRPPAPWNLRAFADETSSVIVPGTVDALTFTWDQVNLDNYTRMYQDTRLYCNLAEAQQTGILEYVGIDSNCETGKRNSVRLDVVDYKVYRFTSFDIAGRFKDSDGDGVADSDERSMRLQCDASRQPPDAPNYLAPTGDTGDIELLYGGLMNPNNPKNVRLRDRVPAAVVDNVDNKDRVFWYRIASVASTPVPYGRLSFLSAPQRGFFPDREPPAPPIVTVTKPGIVPDGCRIERGSNKQWGFSEELSEDGDDKGIGFTFSCSSGQAGPYNASQLKLTTANACNQIRLACDGESINITAPATSKTGGKACDVPVSAGIDICQTGSINLVPDFVAGQVAVGPGELVLGGATITIEPPEPESGKGPVCTALFENMDGTVTRIGSTCDPAGITYQASAGMFCGYSVTTDQNNNISTTVQIPCTLAPVNPKAPGPPQILSLDIDNQLARFTFRLPAEEVAVAIARLDHEPGNGPRERDVETIAVIDNEPGETISYSIPVDALQVDKDRFCLSMLAVGRDEGDGSNRNSDWSVQRCFARTSGGEDIPEYLPWPVVTPPAEGEPLVAGLRSGFRAFRPFLVLSLARADGLLDDCARASPGVPESEMSDFDTYACTSAGMTRFKSELASELGFVLYRQSRTQGGGNESDWIQVSPLIDYVHFDRVPPMVFGKFEVEWFLNDPFIKTALLSNSDLLSVWFIDRYPYMTVGNEPFEWRYQAVYFDANQRPVKWRQTDWFRDAE